MIRPAEQSDAAGILDLWNWMIRDTLATFTSTEKTESAVREMVAERDGAFFLIEQKTDIAGFVTFGPFRSGPGYSATVEHSLIVHPGKQGGGLGRTLMTKAIEAASSQSKHAMVGAISGANPAAIAFHEAMGFQEVGRLPEVGRKAGQWLDLVLMQKNLRR